MNQLKPIMLEEKLINLVITDTFDLGYFLTSTSGGNYQLRVPEMKGDTLHHHLNGTGEKMIGIELSVFNSVTFPGRVSQLTQKEIYRKVDEFNRNLPTK